MFFWRNFLRRITFFKPFAWRNAFLAGEHIGENRAGREAAARGDLVHFQIRLLQFQALGLRDAIAVHKLVEGAAIFRLDEVGQVGPLMKWDK